MNDRPDEGAMARLVDAVLAHRADGDPVPAPEQLAEAHGVPVERVMDALAGLDAMGDLARNEPLPAPSLPDDYEVLGELGRGGMGIVYRARQRSLDREVAVKVLHPAHELLGDAIERFGRETRALARLRHPHIVAIHEVGEAEGRLFFTMDLIEGQTLARFLATRKRPVPVAHAVKLVRQVADAIAFVHEHGMVHRDLKPANVLLDDAGDAFVVDFGIATDPSAGVTLTATGRLMGTPAYMAPEQALGQRAKVTERTDIYSLGVMLYELVTGKPPFEEESVVATIQAVANDEPRRPSKLRRELPLPLENIIAEAMAKDPARRYGTARALEEDLGRFARGEVVNAAPPSFARSAVRLGRRWRRPLLAAAVALALAAGIVAGGHSDLFGKGPLERLATIEALEAEGEWRAADLLAMDALDALDLDEPLDDVEAKLAFTGLGARLGEIRSLPEGEERRRRIERYLEDVERYGRSSRREFSTELLRVAGLEACADNPDWVRLAEEYGRIDRALEEEGRRLVEERRPNGPRGGREAEATVLREQVGTVFQRPAHVLFGVVTRSTLELVARDVGVRLLDGIPSRHWQSALASYVERYVPNSRTSPGALVVMGGVFERRGLGNGGPDRSAIYRLLSIAKADKETEVRRSQAFLCASAMARAGHFYPGRQERDRVAPGDLESVRTSLAEALEGALVRSPDTATRGLADAALEAIESLDFDATRIWKSTVVDWARHRLGYDGQHAFDKFAEWWRAHRTESIRGHLVRALGVQDLEPLDRGDLRALLQRALDSDSELERHRVHELLTHEFRGVPNAPHFPWTRWSPNPCPREVLFGWWAVLGGEPSVPLDGVDGWVILWHDGIGAPTVVAKFGVSRGEQLELRVPVPATGRPVGSLDPFAMGLPGRQQSAFDSLATGEFGISATLDWSGAGRNERLIVYAQAFQRPHGHVQSQLLEATYAEYGQLDLDGGLHVVGDWLSVRAPTRHRLAVVMRGRGPSTAPEIDRVEVLADSLMGDLRDRVQKGGLPKQGDLLVAARLAADLSTHPEVASASRELARAIDQQIAGDGNGWNSKRVMQATALVVLSGMDLGPGILGRWAAFRKDVGAGCPERVLLLEDRDDRRLALLDLQRRSKTLTPVEHDQALEGAGRDREETERVLVRQQGATPRSFEPLTYLSLYALLAAAVVLACASRRVASLWIPVGMLAAGTVFWLSAGQLTWALQPMKIGIALAGAGFVAAGWAHTAGVRPLAGSLMAFAILAAGAIIVVDDVATACACTVTIAWVAAIVHGVQGQALRKRGRRLDGGGATAILVTLLLAYPAYCWVGIASGLLGASDVPNSFAGGPLVALVLSLQGVISGPGNPLWARAFGRPSLARAAVR